MNHELVNFVAERLASFASDGREDALLDSNNRLYSLPIEMRFKYHKRAEDLLRDLSNCGMSIFAELISGD